MLFLNTFFQWLTVFYVLSGLAFRGRVMTDELSSTMVLSLEMLLLFMSLIRFYCLGSYTGGLMTIILSTNPKAKVSFHLMK